MQAYRDLRVFQCKMRGAITAADNHFCACGALAAAIGDADSVIAKAFVFAQQQVATSGAASPGRDR
ncbi:hypothetical protein RC54_13075 [Herbaspirillum rubrisubalbicans]|uniref:Uncharacterized protein n=1 Tax=Herbaspirillum rubrisubalbicans TaxID=80842 RepID=A0AAD0UA97_9BURK|nr:hypothetical protein RC54_13075 [Herbaspirillum rubrisubalbicans]